MTFLKSKKNKFVVWSAGVTLLLVLLNIYLTFFPFFRIDFSQGKIYSLSDISKNIVKNLDDIVYIKVYMTQDLPPEVKPVSKNLKAILSEFERNNKKRLKVVYLDPSKNEKIKADADFAGIQQLQFSSTRGNKLEVANAYFGLSMSYGKSNVILPVAGDIENLEYFLVSGLKRVTSKSVPKIAIAEELFTQQETSELTYLRKMLSQNYMVSDANLDSDKPLSEDVEVLIISNRAGKLNDINKTKIIDWIKKGKGLVVFNERINVDSYMKATPKNESGLEEILKNYGFEFEQKIVMDESSYIANFKTSKGTFTIPYLYWIQIRPENINRKIPAMSGLSKIILEWSSPLKLSGDAQPLFTTTDKAGIDENFKSLSPIDQKKILGEKSKYVLAGVNNKNNIKIAVIADSDFIKDQYVINNQQNLAMAMNLVDYFSQDNSLMQIRGKTITSYPINIINDTAKNILKIVNVVIPILLLIFIYFISNLIRKKKNTEY